MRSSFLLLILVAGLPSLAKGQQVTSITVNGPIKIQGSSSTEFAVEVTPPPNGTMMVQGTLPTPDTFQPPNLFQQPPAQLTPVPGEPEASKASTEISFDWKPTDNLFNYSWIDFGEGHGLRIHRLEWTNGWTDMRAPDFFNRSADERHFEAGLSFAVQWWKERPRPDSLPAGSNIPPPVLYDLYLDLNWRADIAPGWLIDLAYSPGLSTDFRVTPPDGFRNRAHAITMVDMLPSLRGVLGIWYLNRNTTKLLPVAGVVWQSSDVSRWELLFPQPRYVQELGCWKNRTWEWTVSGEFGGGGWAFKNADGVRETINYDDLRVLTGINAVGKHGEMWLQVGYIFNRQLRYAQEQSFDYNPGNAIMVRVGCAY
jgi:hypothetical protein